MGQEFKQEFFSTRHQAGVPWWYLADIDSGSGGFKMAALMCWYLLGMAGQLGSTVDQYTYTLLHHHSSVRMLNILHSGLGLQTWHSRSYSDMYEQVTEHTSALIHCLNPSQTHPDSRGVDIRPPQVLKNRLSTNSRPYFKTTTLPLDTNSLSKFSSRNSYWTPCQTYIWGNMSLAK